MAADKQKYTSSSWLPPPPSCDTRAAPAAAVEPPLVASNQLQPVDNKHQSDHNNNSNHNASNHQHQHHFRHRPAAGSIAIQLPVASSSTEHLQYHPAQDQPAAAAQPPSFARGGGNLISCSTTTTTAPKTPVLNHCHHEAATRSLLYANRNRAQAANSRNNNNSSGSRSTSTSDLSDEQQQHQQPATMADNSPTPPPHYHEIPGIVPAYQGRSSGPPPSYDEVVNPNAPPPSYQSLFGQVREARKTSNGLVDLLRQLLLILIGTLGCTMIIGFLLLIPITMILVGIVYVNECKAENIPLFLVIGGIVWIMKNILNCYNQFKKDSSISNRPPPRRTPARSPAEPLDRSPSPAGVLIHVNGHTPAASGQAIRPLGANASPGALAPSSSASQQQTAPATTRTRRDLQNHNHPQQQQPHQQPVSQPSANERIRTPSLIRITSFKCESLLNYFLIVWFLAGCIVVYRIYEPDYDNPMSNSYCHRTVYLYAFWLMTSAFIIMAIVLSCLCCLMASSLMSCGHGR